VSLEIGRGLFDLEGPAGSRPCATVPLQRLLSNKTALAMVFKLVEAAQRAWRRLDGCNQLPKVILGVKFADGLEVTTKPKTTRQPATAAA
jgi:hypothetical protein